MKRIITGLAASTAMLVLSVSANAAARMDTTDGAAASNAVVKMAQSSGTGASTGNAGSTAKQQFTDPKVRTTPGTTDEPSTTGSTTTGSGAAATGSGAADTDASQSKRKNDEDPAAQSGSK